MQHQRLMWIFWPAFLVAGVLEVLVFALIDPQDLQWFGQHLDWSRNAVYTVSFFVLWGVTAVSSGLTTLLAQSPFRVNQCPMLPEDRPEACPRPVQH